MSASAAIVFDDVHKQYRVYHQRSRSLKDLLLRRQLHDFVARPALAGVSFEVARGASVGLLGPNGAGKSTALKLVARVLEPDRGRVVASGRLGSLIELGAGFHPESTGRENIFLNASLLGMSDRDIRSRLDQVVEFAGLESVIDQPLRTYSSGMQVRLGFSVAIHTDPEILLLDEVLAVGDEAFQLRCFDFIRRFQKAGGTLLFVSHSMEAVREVCTDAAWFEAGRLREFGPAAGVIANYLEQVHEAWARTAAGEEVAGDRPAVVLGPARVLDGEGRPADAFAIGDTLCLEIPFRRLREIPNPVFGIAVHRVDGMLVYGCNTEGEGVVIESLPESGVARFRLHGLQLLDGRYRLTVGIFSGTLVAIDYHDQRYAFSVRAGGAEHGVVRLAHEWEVESRPV